MRVGAAGVGGPWAWPPVPGLARVRNSGSGLLADLPTLGWAGLERGMGELRPSAAGAPAQEQHSNAAV